MVSPRSLTRFSSKEIKHLFAHAHRAIKERDLTILRATRSKEFARILIVTPAKSGVAPLRNLIRRRLKSIFYEEKLYTTTFDYVVIIKKANPERLSFDALKKLLIKASTP